MVLFNVSIPNHILNTISERFLIRFCAVIIFCTLIVKREGSQSKIETALEYIGMRTLDVYIIHYFFIQNISFFAFGNWTVTTGNVLLLTIVSLLITVLIIYLSIWTGRILRESALIRRFAFGDFK